MAESNNEKKLESMFYEADIIEVGGRYPGGKRGKRLKEQAAGADGSFHW